MLIDGIQPPVLPVDSIADVPVDVDRSIPGKLFWSRADTEVNRIASRVIHQRGHHSRGHCQGKICKARQRSAGISDQSECSRLQSQRADINEDVGSRGRKAAAGGDGRIGRIDTDGAEGKVQSHIGQESQVARSQRKSAGAVHA